MKNNQSKGHTPSPKAAVFFAHIEAVKPANDLEELESFKIFKMGWDNKLLADLLKQMGNVENKNFKMLNYESHFEVVRLPNGRIVGTEQQETP